MVTEPVDAGNSNDLAGVGDALAPAELGTTRRWPLIAVLGTLVVSNVVANEVIPAWAYVPWNCGVAALLLVTAIRFDGRSTDELGLAARKVPSGLRWGGAFSLGLLGIYLIGMVLPFTDGLFEDTRGQISLASLSWQVLIVVPLGTVLMEEIAFRGVLPAMFRARFAHHSNGALRADLASALLFGFWHVLPSWNTNDTNPVFRDLLGGPLGHAVTIAGSVLGTAAAGMAFSWLRNRSDSLAAPMSMHWSLNSLGYILSWIVQH